MSEQTIIFTDLDGTLMDHYTYKSTEALPLLKQLKQANIPVILTTSKTFSEVIEIQNNLAINAPLIIENGAAVLLPKRIFNVQPKNTKEENEYWIKSFCFSRQHWLDVIDNSPAHFKEHYQGFSTISVKALAEITGLNEADAARAKDRQYGEPIHWVGDEKNKAEFIQYLEHKGATILHGGRFFHVSGKSDKGKALQWLTNCYQQVFNFNKVTTVALGDGKNDIAMLDAADIAVQIRSPVHDFPLLNKKEKVIKTQGFGPVGWVEALKKILPSEKFTD